MHPSPAHILLVGTDCTLTFHVPLCLCTLAEWHSKTSSSIVSIWQVPTHLSWLTSSISSLGIHPWGPASRRNGHPHSCFPRPPRHASSMAMEVSHQNCLWVSPAVRSLRTTILSVIPLAVHMLQRISRNSISGIIGVEHRLHISLGIPGLCGWQDWTTRKTLFTESHVYVLRGV